MFSLLAVLCVFAATIRGSSAQIPFLGKCPSIAPMLDFDPAKYIGKWYEAERYFAIFQLGGKCVTATYGQLPDGPSDTITVNNRQINTITGSASTIGGTARVVGNVTDGHLAVTFPSIPVNREAPYWVIGTDYDNYAVVWSCNDFGFFNTQFSWILTRARRPTVEVMEKAYSILDKDKVSRAYFFRTDQKNCPDQY